MDKKIKKKWLKALRSGNYDQGKGTLCSIAEDGEASYCCLGVLVEEEQGEDVWVKNKICYTSYDPYHIRGTNNDGSLTTVLAKRAGLHGVTSTSNVNEDIEEELIALNDEAEATFEEIANFIEKNL